MSSDEAEILRKHLEIVRAKKGQLIAEFKERWEKIEAREKMILEDLGEEHFPSPQTDEFWGTVLTLGNATMAQAAELALSRIGAPAKMPQITALLQAHGFNSEVERNKLGNSLFRAMERSDVFVKNNDLTWSLAKWTRKKGE